VRLSRQEGGYRVTVFTAPTPLRAGPVDVSVFVQDAAKGEPLSGGRVTVRAVPRGRAVDAIEETATTEAATNKLFRAAVFDLPGPGWWEIEVRIEGPHGGARVGFQVEAAEALPHWASLWPWVSWPAVAVLLFAVHQWLVRRKAR
jgi:hypothetical protein